MGTISCLSLLLAVVYDTYSYGVVTVSPKDLDRIPVTVTRLFKQKRVAIPYPQASTVPRLFSQPFAFEPKPLGRIHQVVIFRNIDGSSELHESN